MRPNGCYYMGGRGYTLIDFEYPRHDGAGWDDIVRLMEYVRQHLRELAPGVPADSEVDLFAGGSAHNVGLRPMVGLHSTTPEALAAEPEFWDLIDPVDDWVKSLSADQFWHIVQATHGPTWAELQASGTYPARRRDA